MNDFKIAQRQYRSIGDENVSEEMVDLYKYQEKILPYFCKNVLIINYSNYPFVFDIFSKGRQFDFLRDDLKNICKKQNALLETNIQLM